MKTVTTLDNQALIDIAMQELGDVERVNEIMLLNDLPLTANLTAGTILFVPDFNLTKRRVVNLFSKKSLAPASLDDEDDLIRLPPGGIGFMQIGNSFIVS